LAASVCYSLGPRFNHRAILAMNTKKRIQERTMRKKLSARNPPSTASSRNRPVRVATTPNEMPQSAITLLILHFVISHQTSLWTIFSCDSLLLGTPWSTEYPIGTIATGRA